MTLLLRSSLSIHWCVAVLCCLLASATELYSNDIQAQHDAQIRHSTRVLSDVFRDDAKTHLRGSDDPVNNNTHVGDLLIDVNNNTHVGDVPIDVNNTHVGDVPIDV
eukprot:CAMPEP_0113850772 /NCGR_PEP_ID=MMETSP0372-20130328/4137_1 /TAXON_ID=340204 /ORGANISM="Lankesteria abbotti" /LENGTH=105 /DNA_ID=CAMNT_0000821241 /DNA_START=76 /DNA_END=390 /DNA_ORIENTATION=+ /assembly_acc=CAM_ASM_000359